MPDETKRVYNRIPEEQRLEAKKELFKYLQDFGSISVFEARRLLTKYDSNPRGSIFLRQCLLDLCEEGLAEVTGERRSRRYVKRGE